MSDTKPTSEETQATEKTTKGPWDDVIRDFQSLGQSITNAVQDAMQDEKHKETLHELRQGLENVANQVVKSIDEAAKSPQVDDLRSGVKRAVGDVRGLGGKVYSDTKPVVISALKGLSDGIQKMIDHLQETEAPKTETEAEATSTEE